jgi:hypothetical protein
VATSLDDLLPKHTVRTRHRRAARAEPGALWEEAARLRVRDARVLGPMIARRLGRHLPSADVTFRELFRTGIFTLLEEGERYSISGAAGRIWSPAGPFERFESAADYRKYDSRGTAKVAVLTAVREHRRGAQIVSEARVWCTDRRAWLHFMPLWGVVAPFDLLIGREVLRTVVRRAERPTRGGT